MHKLKIEKQYVVLFFINLALVLKKYYKVQEKVNPTFPDICNICNIK